MADNENAEVKGKGYVVPCLVHIFAASADEAEALIEKADGVVFDAGPVTITSELGSIELLYINGPDVAVDEAQGFYDYPFDNDEARAFASHLRGQIDRAVNHG